MTSMTKRAVAAAALAVAVTLPLAGTASADHRDVPGTLGARTLTNTPEPTRPAFYEPPATIPSTPGTLIRSEPAPLLLDPLGLSSSVVTATRVMYSSTDGQGRPIAVTGTVFVPKTTYRGSSARPLISYAPGTQGMGDSCAPSRQMESLVEYEGIGITPAVARGYAVSITDYQGLGTAGTHTYMVREAQGRAVLDMARATKNLKGSGITASNPIGLMGYSQGGGAAGAAAAVLERFGVDRQVLAAQGLEGLSVGDAEDPGGELAAPVEAVDEDDPQLDVVLLLERLQVALEGGLVEDVGPVGDPVPEGEGGDAARAAFLPHEEAERLVAEVIEPGYRALQ